MEGGSFGSAGGRIPEGGGGGGRPTGSPPPESVGGYKYKITVSFSSVTN